MNELDNCPFCGSGIDNATPHPFPANFWPGGRTAREWIARCGNPDCGAEIAAPTAALAAERWNRRTAPGEPGAEIRLP